MYDRLKDPNNNDRKGIKHVQERDRTKNGQTNPTRIE